MFVIITNVCCCSEDSLLPRPAGLGLAFIAVSLKSIHTSGWKLLQVSLKSSGKLHFIPAATVVQLNEI